MEKENEYVPMQEAQRILGISGNTMWRLVKSGQLKTFQSGVDRRRKLVRRSDLEQLMSITPVDVNPDSEEERCDE